MPVVRAPFEGDLDASCQTKSLAHGNNAKIIVADLAKMAIDKPYLNAPTAHVTFPPRLTNKGRSILETSSEAKLRSAYYAFQRSFE